MIQQATDASMPLRDEDEVFWAVAKRLDYEPDPKLWEDLKRYRYVGDVLFYSHKPHEQAKALDDLVRRYRNLERRERAAARHMVEQVPADERLQARARIIAWEAAHHPDVMAFRRKWLPGGLLANAEEAAAWIRSHDQGPGGVRCYIEFPLPPGVWPDPLRGKLSDPSLLWEELSKFLAKACEYHAKHDKSGRGLRWRLRGDLGSLSFFDPAAVPDTYVEGESETAPWDSDRTDRVSVAPDTALEDLKLVASSLSSLYGWEEPVAVHFVLCGEVPARPKASVEITFSIVSSGPLEETGPCITVHTDGRLTAAELAKLYERARRQLVKRGDIPKRDRPLSRKHAELAVFLVQTPDQTWQKRLEAWNRNYPHWSYPHRLNFSRDAIAAFYRVTGQKWEDVKERLKLLKERASTPERSETSQGADDESA